MIRVLVFAGAANALLEVIEAFFPATQSFLPLGQHGLIQSGGLLTGSLAVWILMNAMQSRKSGGENGSGGAEKDQDNDKNQLML